MREPLTIGVMAFGVSAAISTVWSISPRISLFGAIESFAGLTTLLCYGVLFGAARGFCRDAGDVRRLTMP